MSFFRYKSTGCTKKGSQIAIRISKCGTSKWAISANAGLSKCGMSAEY